MKTFLLVATFMAGLSDPHIEAVEMPDVTPLQCQALINKRQPNETTADPQTGRMIAKLKADCIAGETEEIVVAQFRKTLPR